MTTEIKELKEQIKKLPEEISFNELKLISLNNALTNFQLKKKTIEQNTYKEILSDMVRDGEKVKPKYSNEAKREVELNSRLFINMEYKDLSEKEKEKTESVQKTKVDLDALKRQFKSVGYLIDLLKLERCYL